MFTPEQLAMAQEESGKLVSAATTVQDAINDNADASRLRIALERAHASIGKLLLLGGAAIED